MWTSIAGGHTGIMPLCNAKSNNTYWCEHLCSCVLLCCSHHSRLLMEIIFAAADNGTPHHNHHLSLPSIPSPPLQPTTPTRPIVPLPNVICCQCHWNLPQPLMLSAIASIGIFNWCHWHQHYLPLIPSTPTVDANTNDTICRLHHQHLAIIIIDPICHRRHQHNKTKTRTRTRITEQNVTIKTSSRQVSGPLNVTTPRTSRCSVRHCVQDKTVYSTAFNATCNTLYDVSALSAIDTINTTNV